MKGHLCAGQKNNLRLGLYRCPECGAKMEIFSDESEIKCYNCGGTVYREKLSPCIDWCVSAHDCTARNKNRKKEV